MVNFRYLLAFASESIEASSDYELEVIDRVPGEECLDVLFENYNLQTLIGE